MILMSVLTTEKFEKWVVELRNSNEEAFSELFRQTYNPMLRYALRFTADEEAARDILQDVYIKLWNKRVELEPDKSLKAYLYSMVRNRCYNYIRDHSRVEVGLDESMPAEIESQNEEQEKREAESLKSRINSWIEDLPIRQREAFELSRFEGLDHSEIAEIMDCSPRTVNNHIVSALNFLRNKYQQHQ